MTLRTIRTSATALAAAIATIGSSAIADQVVMPYRCEAFGRDISLTPSEPRSYDIYGHREQDMVTACAPDNPNRCRSWRLHRFEMNCGGARVPWIDVVDAANAVSGGPARVRNGRLYVRMDPWWARRRQPEWADRPKLREFEDGDLRPDRFRPPQRDFRDQGMGRAPQVEMPPGFAPVVGLNARFVGGPSAGSQSFADNGQGRDASRGADREGVPFDDPDQPPARNGNDLNGARPPSAAPLPPVPNKQIAAKPLPDPPAKAATVTKDAAATTPSNLKSSLRDSGHTFEPKNADSKPAEAKSAEAKPSVTNPPEATPADETATSSAAPPTPPVTTAAIPAPAAAPVPDPTINSVAPTILNRPGAESTAITSATSSSGDKSGTQVAAAETAMPVTLEAPLSPPPLMTPPATALKSWAMLAGTAALLLLGTAFVVFKRRQGSGGFASPIAHRDLSSVSLDSVQSRAVAVRTVPAAPETPTPRAPQLPPQLSAPQPIETFVTAPVPEPEWLPSTREEALQVLGAGPDASEAVVKKIVDGLRMSWHPDLAKSSDEYRLRSERMTQINVAWDILSGRQSEVRRAV